jgi:hypothetical protein
MSGKSAEDHPADHTDPELRARLGEEIEAGDRGASRDGGARARASCSRASRRRTAGGGDFRLDRAEQTGRELGKGRKTVLEAIERRRDRGWRTGSGASAAREGAPRGPGAPRSAPRGV